MIFAVCQGMPSWGVHGSKSKGPNRSMIDFGVNQVVVVFSATA